MTNALVDTIVDMPMEFTVLATHPSEMEKAQKSLILWSARKIQEMKQEQAEAQEQLDIATQRKWNTDAWRRQVGKLARKAEFYRKIKMALEAGYYIVPPFPIDIFAIRTDRKKPLEKTGRHHDNHDQKARFLPAGEGRYVDPKPVRETFTDVERDREGKDKQVAYFFASDFNEPDFPFKLAKSEILDATQRAMGLKIFDRMGVLPSYRAPDPIVCGQIIYPDQPSWGDKALTFFVAWWLDTKTI